MSDEIERVAERVAADPEHAVAQVLAFLGHIADRGAGAGFAAMRRERPIVTLGPTTIVTLDEDVREVLGDPARFTVGRYAPKMAAITGPFMLGLDDPLAHRHDRAAMDRALTREDLRRIAAATYEVARGLVAEHRGDGRIDVVGQLADPALDHVVTGVFGTPAPDAATQLRWARSIYEELFVNVADVPAIRDRALADAAAWRSHLDGLIGVRKRALQAGDDVPDDVLTRLLRLQGEAEPRLDDVAIRHNVLGMVTGWLPTVSNAFARIVDELLRRREDLERAQQAARAGDRELVAAHAFEASRFRPQNFALLRHVAGDTTIAPGTERETPVQRGSTVLAVTLSAMHDERAIDDPEAFRVDRPRSDHLLFGHGMHSCYGRQVVRAQLPALAAALLEGPPIGRAGRIRFDGPYPSSLPVGFDG
ncbi:MAG TPA: cytochrome P450 [Solirubrobacteraceae bacterium]|nr:cytochrome P450 [Solirubrobacteraceae bacterium]